MDEITIAHQHLLSTRFRDLDLMISEYNFPNIFLFRQVHQYRLFESKGFLFIKGMTRDRKSFLMPTFPIQDIDNQRLLEIVSSVDFFYPIPEIWLKSFDLKLFKTEFVESDSDYLFYPQKLATYPGRHLSSKRNLVKQFMTHYESTFEPLSVGNRAFALSILEKWQQHQELELVQTDFFSCQEALTLLEELELSGFILFANQEPCAFVIGGKSDHSCYNIHFAKALKTYKGVYQYLYQAVAKSLEGQTDFINLEQDLGSSSVHQAKHSYHPDLMIHKWRVSKRL